MTHHTFDVHIRIKPNALIQSLYSGRSYTASDLKQELEFMAVMEHGNYVFRLESSLAYAVSPDDVEVINYD